MRLQDVFDLLRDNGWIRIDERIRLENVSDYRLYARQDKPGVVITLVGTPDMYVGPSAVANILARAGIETDTADPTDPEPNESEPGVVGSPALESN